MSHTVFFIAHVLSWNGGCICDCTSNLVKYECKMEHIVFDLYRMKLNSTSNGVRAGWATICEPWCAISNISRSYISVNLRNFKTDSKGSEYAQIPKLNINYWDSRGTIENGVPEISYGCLYIA